MKFLLIFLTLSWASAGVPGTAQKPRPIPIEPDATSNGGFHSGAKPVFKALVPEILPAVETPIFESKAPIVEAKKKAKPKKEVVPDGVEDTKPKVPEGVEPQSNIWRPDANGNYWARDAYGNWYYGPDSVTVQSKGQPYNK